MGWQKDIEFFKKLFNLFRSIISRRSLDLRCRTEALAKECIKSVHNISSAWILKQTPDFLYLVLTDFFSINMY